MAKSHDDRSQMAKAVSMGSEVVAICFMMILPGLIGYWVDQWLGTVLVFTLLGLAFGMFASVYQLMHLVSAMNRVDDPAQTSSDEEDGQSRDQ